MKYVPTEDRQPPIPVWAIDDLAKDLGVVPKDGYWDFGDFIMR